MSSTPGQATGRCPGFLYAVVLVVAALQVHLLVSEMPRGGTQESCLTLLVARSHSLLFHELVSQSGGHGESEATQAITTAVLEARVAGYA